MKNVLLVFSLSFGYFLSVAQSANQAIDFINGKSNTGAHDVFSDASESRTWSEIKKDGTVVHIVTVYKDRETKQQYSVPKKSTCVINMKYLNPFNIKAKYYGRDIFYIELNTTNGLRKGRTNYYGVPIEVNSTLFGPYDRTDEPDLEERLKKAFAVAITQFGGKPDSF